MKFQQNPKYKHKLKVDPQKQRLIDESFEIYSKINKGKTKMQKFTKKTPSLKKNNMCPITIIQAPITVNGENSVNVHQEIVLKNGVKNKIQKGTIQKSANYSINQKAIHSKYFKENQGSYDIQLRNTIKRGNNPYSRKFCVRSKNQNRSNNKNSNYSNSRPPKFLLTKKFSDQESPG